MKRIPGEFLVLCWMAVFLLIKDKFLKLKKFVIKSNILLNTYDIEY